MNEIIFEILRLIVLLAVFVVTCYLIPWVRGKIGQDKLEEITKWVNAAVLMAQQVYCAKTGTERKAIVVDLLSAVKSMKMQEGSNTKIVKYNPKI